MGVVNVTPDSFSDGGKYLQPQSALEQAKRLVAAGADILDIGGESTRPFADPVPLEEELTRVIPAIVLIRQHLPHIPISIDTYKAQVAEAALDAGADIINDISGLRFEPEMISLAREREVPVVVMHMKGRPRDMQLSPHYDDVLGEIEAFFKERLETLTTSGIDLEKIILDPGIGFGKRFEDNLTILRELKRFLRLGRPLLVGPSRKAFIGQITGRPPEERDAGTMGAVAWSVLQGAHILRVHNVAMARDLLAVIQTISARKGPSYG
ncbi:dihydropteroate synthase [Thermosulfuriphilus ammonigenes]|uniref:Dihydropteroate synthase n=2 Tax=Thermosulfuriphilus ammonigenes TaxID=1936021 RepID=A0A6G7PZ34_9BACT|nr:dihydropteroate synthase [Thermosulfuriphilus ammonigenes]